MKTKTLEEIRVDLVDLVWSLRAYARDYQLELMVEELSVIEHKLAKYIDPSLEYEIPENWISD